MSMAFDAALPSMFEVISSRRTTREIEKERMRHKMRERERQRE